MTTDYVKTPINFISFAFLLTIFSAANLYSRIFLLVPGKTQKKTQTEIMFIITSIYYLVIEKDQNDVVWSTFLLHPFDFCFSVFSRIYAFPPMIVTFNSWSKKNHTKKWKNYYHHQNDNNNWFLCRYSATMIDLQCFRCKCSIMSRAGAQRRPILSAKKW